MDAVDRLPQNCDQGVYLDQQVKDKLVGHRQHIETNGCDLPEIRDGRWRAADAGPDSAA
jgi:xylulose-5-phosphate/fructose-6-phosphate phosphoketolase